MLEGYDNPIRLEGQTDRQVEESLKVCLKECIKRRNIDLEREVKDFSGGYKDRNRDYQGVEGGQNGRRKKKKRQTGLIDTRTTKEKNAERNK